MLHQRTPSQRRRCIKFKPSNAGKMSLFMYPGSLQASRYMTSYFDNDKWNVILFCINFHFSRRRYLVNENYFFFGEKNS